MVSQYIGTNSSEEGYGMFIGIFFGYVQGRWVVLHT